MALQIDTAGREQRGARMSGRTSGSAMRILNAAQTRDGGVQTDFPA
jgi:hypothetical protein